MFLFFFLNDCPQRGADLHHHADRPSLKVAVSFHSKNCVRKDTTEHKRKKGLNLTKVCAFVSCLGISGVKVFKVFNVTILFWECNLKKIIIPIQISAILICN